MIISKRSSRIVVGCQQLFANFHEHPQAGNTQYSFQREHTMILPRASSCGVWYKPHTQLRMHGFFRLCYWDPNAPTTCHWVHKPLSRSTHTGTAAFSNPLRSCHLQTLRTHRNKGDLHAPRPAHWLIGVLLEMICLLNFNWIVELRTLSLSLIKVSGSSCGIQKHTFFIDRVWRHLDRDLI